MREYAKVGATFWTGDTGRSLRGHPEAQIVALYLVTGPTANMIGLYHLPITTIAHHTGLTLKGASKGLRRAIEGAFCLYDEVREEVFIPEMAAYQIDPQLSAGDKRCVGIAREWQSYRKSRFYLEFHKRYAKAFHLPAPSPFEAPSKAHRSQEQEQEQEQ